MIQNDNILKELSELQSILASAQPQKTFSAPEGYFDGLSGDVLKRIKAMEAGDASKEISILSPLLSRITNKNPYTVSSGYFNSLEENISKAIHEPEISEKPGKELETLSPLLSGIGKQMPYHVSEDYFENIGSSVTSRLSSAPKAKVIPLIRRKWVRYAAAAVVISFIAVAGLLFEYQSQVDPAKNPDGWVAKNIKKVSNGQLDAFISLANEDLASYKPGNANKEKTDDIKELLRGVPENQLMEFINETAPLGNDLSIMN